MFFTSFFGGSWGLRVGLRFEASGEKSRWKFFQVIRVVQVILFEKNKAQDLYRRRAPWSFPRVFFSWKIRFRWCLTVFGGNGGSGKVPGKQKLCGVFLLVVCLPTCILKSDSIFGLWFVSFRKGGDATWYNQTYAYNYVYIYIDLYIYIYIQIYLYIFNKFKVNLCPVNNFLISIWSESLLDPWYLNSAGTLLVIWSTGDIMYVMMLTQKYLSKKNTHFWVRWWLVNWNVFCFFFLILLEHVRVWKEISCHNMPNWQSQQWIGRISE